jgi:hypothetical protein
MTGSPHPTANETTSVKGVLTPNLRAVDTRTEGPRRRIAEDDVEGLTEVVDLARPRT